MTPTTVGTKGIHMKMTGSALIALSILLGCVVIALGGRYMIVSAVNGNIHSAYRLDRLTGSVSVCFFDGCEPTR